MPSSAQRSSHKLQSGFTQRRRPRHAACSVLRMELRAACRPSNVDCPSRPLGRRANKRRFVNFLQRLGGDKQWAYAGVKKLLDQWPSVFAKDDMKRLIVKNTEGENVIVCC